MSVLFPKTVPVNLHRRAVFKIAQVSLISMLVVVNRLLEVAV